MVIIDSTVNYSHSEDCARDVLKSIIQAIL
jgi:hypothetical protein